MSKALQNPDSPHSHPAALIQKPVPLTQALHSTLDLSKVVTRQSWEQMMLYLIIQTSCKHTILLSQLQLSKGQELHVKVQTQDKYAHGILSASQTVVNRQACAFVHILHDPLIQPSEHSRNAERYTGCSVVLDSMAALTCKPVIPDTRRDVSRRHYLRCHEVLLCAVHLHSIVALNKHNAEEKTTDHLSEQHK